MRLSTHIKPISYLKSHAASIVNQLSENHEPLIITQNGEAKLVVMDIQSFEKYEETLTLLKILAIGQQHIEQGKFRQAGDVFADIEKED